MPNTSRRQFLASLAAVVGAAALPEQLQHELSYDIPSESKPQLGESSNIIDSKWDTSPRDIIADLRATERHYRDKIGVGNFIVYLSADQFARLVAMNGGQEHAAGHGINIVIR